MSQAQLASALGVTQGAISQWESDLSCPRLDKLPDIAKALGCKISDLFKDEA